MYTKNGQAALLGFLFEGRSFHDLCIPGQSLNEGHEKKALTDRERKKRKGCLSSDHWTVGTGKTGAGIGVAGDLGVHGEGGR